MEHFLLKTTELCAVKQAIKIYSDSIYFAIDHLNKKAGFVNASDI